VLVAVVAATEVCELECDMACGIFRGVKGRGTAGGREGPSAWDFGRVWGGGSGCGLRLKGAAGSCLGAELCLEGGDAGYEVHITPGSVVCIGCIARIGHLCRACIRPQGQQGVVILGAWTTGKGKEGSMNYADSSNIPLQSITQEKTRRQTHLKASFGIYIALQFRTVQYCFYGSNFDDLLGTKLS
jgi:hypothetical protein